MPKGKWRTVSVYEPLMKKVDEAIELGIILLPNSAQFVNSVVEKELMIRMKESE